MAIITEAQWEKEKSRLVGAITRAKTKMRAAVLLQAKLVEYEKVKAAQEALCQHKLNFYKLTSPV